MGYSDAQFNARPLSLVSDNTSWGTATASSATGHVLSTVVELPKFIRRTKINAVRLKVRTIPNAASTALVAHLLNGTNTAGTAVLTTAALSADVNFTLTTASCTWAADGEPTISLTGTATASGAANGAYDVFLETQELFS